MKPSEIVVKIDDANGDSSSAPNPHVRGSSYDFDGGRKTGGSSDNTAALSSPTGNIDFSFRQTAAAESASVARPPLSLAATIETLKVSFNDHRVHSTAGRRSTDYNDSGELSTSDESSDDTGYTTAAEDHRHNKPNIKKLPSHIDRAEVIRCTSNATFNRSRTLSRTKTTRSRLLDPPSSELKSGALRPKPDANDEDDDPFFSDDLPTSQNSDPIGIFVILEWISLFFTITSLISTLSIPNLKHKSLWNLKLWKWSSMALVLISGRLLSGWGIKILVFIFERSFMLRKRVLYFVYGLRSAVRNCIWLGLVLLTWHFLFDLKVEDDHNNTKRILNNVTKALVICFSGAVIWLLKTLAVKLLASSFHVNAFFDRIQETLFSQFVVETLAGPPLFEVGDEVAPRHMFSSEMSMSIRRLQRLNQRNVSAWNMKRLMNVVRRGTLRTLDEGVVSLGNEDEREIRTEVEAKAAARKIFRNVARPGSRFIYFEDLLRFMPEEEASKTLGLFEEALERERISKSSLKNWVVNAFRGRRALALTINDTKTAVDKLHKIVNFIVSIIIALISLIILNIATTKFLVFLSSQVLLVAFVFGNFCKNVFESIIFLFVVHPYDVGDRCEIDGVQMVVEEMNILTTVFLRYDNQKIVFPNYVLLSKPIGNYYRSPDMGDGVEFCFHILMPPEKISLIKQRIISYIENKKEHWYPNPMVLLKNMEDINKLRIGVWVQHKINHQDMGERWSRRALLLEECVKIFRELDIEYRVLPLNVNVRNMPPLTCENTPPNADIVHR